MSTSVASVVSHFPSAENGFTTTLASTISSGATTVPLNSVAGYANGEIAVMVVDPSDATKKQTFTGVVDTSGVQLTSVVWTAGTNQSHSGGATVVDYATATHISMTSKGILVEHNQDGTHDEAIINSRTSKATPTTSDLVLIADAAASNVLKKATLGNIVPADSITASKIDWASTGANGGIWWEELGRTTLGVAGDTITITSIGARKYLKILITTLDTGGTTGSNIQFNNDSGANYASRYSANGAADTTAVSQTSCLVHGSLNASPMVSEITIYNVAADEKVFSFHASNAGTAGAGNAPNRVEGTGKWSNTSDQITRVDVVNAGTGDFAIGSSVVVLGHD